MGKKSKDKGRKHGHRHAPASLDPVPDGIWGERAQIAAPRRPAAVDVELEEPAIEEAAITEEAIRIPRSVDPTVANDEPAPSDVEPARGLTAELRAAVGEPHSIFAPRYDGRAVDGVEHREAEIEVSEVEPDRGPLAAVAASSGAPKVTDLEKEMARLLGEISGGRGN